MAKFFFASVLLLLSVAIDDAFAHTGRYHTPFHNTLSKRLGLNGHQQRQEFEWEPDIAKCPTECAVLEEAFAQCRTNSACICTDAGAAGFRECLVCSIDLATNAELQADAQHSMDELTANCGSEGFPIASLSVAVAPATAQLPAASSAWHSSWSIPGTVTVYPSPAIAGTSVATPYGSPIVSYWTASDSWGVSLGWSMFSSSTSLGAFPASTGSTNVSLSTATPTIPPDPSPASSDSVAIPSTPLSGTTLITFVSAAATPSASLLNAQAANANSGLKAASLPLITSALVLSSVIVLRIL